MKRLILNSILILCLGLSLSAQVSNDDCQSAIFIPDVTDYCSGSQSYSNVGATPDPTTTNSCFLSFDGGVWFSFQTTEPAVLLQVNGSSTGQGSINSPEIAVFDGLCGNFTQVGCSTSAGGNGVVELTVADLAVGGIYFVYVDGLGTETGTFELCINSFVPPPSPESDCSNGVVLCDKSPFFVENLIGVGSNNNELNPTDCVGQEFASAWYKWTCDTPGSLTFTLTPNNNIAGLETDDLDFILFELPNGINDCSNKLKLRCMASGAIVNQPLSTWAGCNGPTGLAASETDIEEDRGCSPGDNNFIAPLQMEVGKSYALLINNFSQSGLGFSIEFGGSGTFLGPVADFDLFAIGEVECDKNISITDLSSSMTDQIVEWQWNFGVGSTPNSSNLSNPPNIVYDSFGEKLVALTIRSDRGCTVTKILDVFVEACCADTSTLRADAMATDLVCFDIPSGTVTGIGQSGAPPYTYSIGGSPFQPTTTLSNLDSDDYEVIVQDKKGCRDTTDVFIDAPAPLIVTTSPDTSVCLGADVQLNSVVTPPGTIVSVMWNDSLGLSCVDCLDPMAKARGTITYEITVEDEAGCRSSDQVTIFSEPNYDIFAPNVFTPEENNNNVFYLRTGKSVRAILDVRIYDRWGNLVYFQEDLPLNSPVRAWDGRFDRQDVGPAVFTFIANIQYWDDTILPTTGSVTLIR